MRRLHSIEDQVKGIATYELSDGRRVALDAVAVQEYGAAAVLRHMGVADSVPTVRLPVIHDGMKIGTLPADFDPSNVRSVSDLYAPRPGDFRSEGNVWIASQSLGAGDLDAVEGFRRFEQR